MCADFTTILEPNQNLLQYFEGVKLPMFVWIKLRNPVLPYYCHVSKWIHPSQWGTVWAIETVTEVSVRERDFVKWE